MYPNINCSINYNSQDMEATKMSINRPLDKIVVVYILNGILPVHKKNEILIILTLVDLEGMILSEICEIGKDKFCMISLICEI